MQAFPSAQAGQMHLRILETTDLHAHVLPYDYYADRPDDSFGLVRAAALIAAARAEAANTLLLDNGDFLQGDPMADYVAHERGLRPGAPHPVIAAMNALGYDGATPGNHDLDYGLDFLMTCAEDAEFPLVSANLVAADGADGPEGARPILPPFVMLDRTLRDGAGGAHPIRIGLIGFLPPQTAIWNHAHLDGRASAQDIVAAARRWAPQVKAAGADLVIALCHSGIGAAEHSPGMENAAAPLAREPGIDVLLTGHSHRVFPDPSFAGRADIDAGRGTIAGKPAVMAGFWGSHVGQIDLLLERAGGGWRIVEHRSAALSTAPDPATPRNTAPLAAECAAAEPVIAAARADHLGALAYIRRPVGRSEVALNSFFALVSDCAVVRLVAEAQAAHVAARLRGDMLAGLPIVSAAAPFKTGGRAGPANYTDIAPGDLTLGNVSDLYPFPNTVCALRLTGAQLADWLERAASVFRQIAPQSRDAALLSPICPGYNFDTIHGVTYRIDLSQPPRYDELGTMANGRARRIRDLSHAGRPIDPDQPFILATNSYRGLGGGDFPGATMDNLVFEGPSTNREALLNHLRALGLVGAQRPAPAWRFCPMPGATVVFDTSPRARDHLGALGDLALDDLGAGEGGFARFRIRL
jgi:2',3'-cyclic-nucleotide 2'-phosphodiesterase/3'-nucleotidase